MSVVIIGGTPGAGKSSLAQQLATSVERGVHVEADAFFRFLARRTDPSLPGAASQNATVVRAYARAAVEYSDGGYQVFLDGVIGPWLLPQIASIVSEYEYLILHVSLETALRRTSERAGQRSAKPEVVRRMHAEFDRILPQWRSNVIEVDDMSVAEVALRWNGMRSSLRSQA